MIPRAAQQLWDDPEKDFRQRYVLPEQFIWDKADLPRMDFDGYMAVTLGLLPKPPARVVDVGCGPGLGAKIMSQHGYEVVGLDYSQRGVAFAKLLVPEAQFFHADVRLLADMTHLHNQFDVATHIEVFEHIPPEFHSQVLQGIHTLLRPSGLLILSVPSIHMPLNKWHYKHFFRDEIISLIRENGFQVQKAIYQHYISILFSYQFWRLIRNRYYDIPFIRYKLREVFLRWYNTTNDSEKAGRFIIKAQKILNS